MIGDVPARVRLCRVSGGRSQGSRTTPAGPTSIRRPSRWAGSSPASGTTASSGYEGCRVGRAIGTYLHGPLLPRNPWLADWLLSQALAHATGGEPPELEPLPDHLEAEAHAVSAQRARDRGGRY